MESTAKIAQWSHIMPEGQKCRRELEDMKKDPSDCSDATSDYNGYGYWVCGHCHRMLSETFEDNYA